MAFLGSFDDFSAPEAWPRSPRVSTCSLLRRHTANVGSVPVHYDYDPVLIDTYRAAAHSLISPDSACVRATPEDLVLAANLLMLKNRYLS